MDNNLITFVPQQGAFIVQGRKGKYCTGVEVVVSHSVSRGSCDKGF
jgi:hypothetical protein